MWVCVPREWNNLHLSSVFFLLKHALPSLKWAYQPFGYFKTVFSFVTSLMKHSSNFYSIKFHRLNFRIRSQSKLVSN